MHHHHLHLLQCTRFIICSVVHRCCLIFYGKNFTPYDVSIFDSADGRISWQSGIINQTVFKTKEKYGFNLLMFSNDGLALIKNYISYIWPHLNLSCDYVFICENGNQISKLSNILGRIVFFSNRKLYLPDIIQIDY